MAIKVDVSNIVGTNLLIGTTRENVNRIVRDARKQKRADLAEMYRRVFVAVRALDPHALVTAANAGDADAQRLWGEYCTDAVLLAALRQVLYGRAVECAP